jgi:hypothetical protein
VDALGCYHPGVDAVVSRDRAGNTKYAAIPQGKG